MDEKMIVNGPQMSESSIKDRPQNKKIDPLKAEENNEPFKFINTNPDNIFQGIIWSEILGKPKSLRKGR